MPTHAVSFREGQALLDIASYARRGPGRRDRLSGGQVEHIALTARRAPEVVVKVSGGGTSAGAVAAHFRYIDRQGELDIETDEGGRLKGKGVEKDLLEDWDLESEAAELSAPYRGSPGRRANKLVHNIVLSMPAGTSPDGLLAASSDFAREQFALKHRYALVLHTDQDHPHVHLVVKAMSEQGERLNVRKATLREWRQEFARHLRAHGVEANATERAVRGESRMPKKDGIYRADRRGASTHMRDRATSVADELAAGEIRLEPQSSKLRQTRKDVELGWRAISNLLDEQRQPKLAEQVRRFVEQMPPPKTEKEWLLLSMLNNSHNPASRIIPATVMKEPPLPEISR